MSFTSVPTSCILSWVLLACLVATSCAIIIDNDSIETIVRDVCWSDNVNKQISRVSTISKVVDYLKSRPAEHEFASCARNNLPTIKHLKLVLAHGNENACGRTKLAFIESFHRRFIDLNNAMSIREPPPIIRAFFLQYASMISQQCASSGLKFLLDNDSVVLNNDINSAMNSYLERFQRYIKISAFEYNHIYLIWGLIDQWPKSVQGTLSNYIHHGQKRISIKVKNAEKFETVQSVCLNTLRPVYQESMLPSIRLINMGYYPFSSDLIQHVSTQPSAGRLYDLMQLCEAIIPIKVVTDSSMGEGSIVFLTAKEIKELEYSESSDIPEEALTKAEPVSLVGVDEIKSITEDNSLKVLEQVSQDMSKRDSSIIRMLEVIAASISTSVIKNIFVSNGDGRVKNFETTFGSLKNALKGHEQPLVQAASKDVVEHRSKRGIFYQSQPRFRWLGWNRWSRCRTKCSGYCICISPSAIIRKIFYFFMLHLLLIAYFTLSTDP